jgi:hypothetical protein
VNPDGTSIQVVSPQRKPLLPNGLPLVKIVGQSVKKMICTKGKATVSVNQGSKCPKGFKKA